MDVISREMKLVAIAVFGEKLSHKMPDAQVAIDNVAAAIAGGLWPDDEVTRRRFIGMCLNEVKIEEV